MSFLLLLSAMLSALTGVMSNGRVEPSQAAVCACVDARVAQPARAAAASVRPDTRPLQPSQTMALAVPAAIQVPTIEPLFASRRRE